MNIWPSTLNKVRAFLSNPIVEHIVGQSHTTISFRTIMDEGKILLVKLPGRYEDISSLIGAVLIGQLLNAASVEWIHQQTSDDNLTSTLTSIRTSVHPTWQLFLRKAGSLP